MNPGEAQNWFAIVALLAWPLVALCLFRTRPLVSAIIWTLLGAYLLLPVGAGIKIEGVPQFDKNSIPSLIVLVGCWLAVRRPLKLFKGLEMFERLLLIAYFAVPFVTANLNTDPIILESVTLEPMSFYDALSIAFLQCITLIPFLLGRQLLRSVNDNEELLRALVLAGVFYSIPILFELRMSPQLHYWFYGYHTAWASEARGDGFRPMVFLGNGIVVTFFMMTTAVAAAAMWRIKVRILKLALPGILAYLLGIIALCRTFGGLFLTAIAVPLVCWTKPRVQMVSALVLTAFCIIYPLLRSADLIPTTSVVEAVSGLSEKRGASLQTRFFNEQQLLNHAAERFSFGWGRFGRSRIYDKETGNDISLTDGGWIITLGQFGIVGFFAKYLFLAMTVLRASLALKFTKSNRDRVLLAALSLIMAVSLIDQLPNSSLSPWTWLLAGALLGRAEALRKLGVREGAPFRRTARTRLIVGTDRG